MGVTRAYTAVRPRWSTAFVLASCTLAGSMCSAFVSPPVSTSAVRAVKATKSAADTACGRQCSTGGARRLGVIPWREPAASALYGAGVEMLDEETALVKFKRLQVSELWYGYVLVAVPRTLMLAIRTRTWL